MAHGYLGDGFGIHGESEERDDRERSWRDGDEHWRDRDRGMMFGDRENRASDEDRWSDRGWNRENRGFGAYAGSETSRRFSANPDDHYRSWRDRHMSELDRDYEEYCREREQQFHSDFDSWRRQRHGNPQPLRTGMTQSGISHDPSGELQLTTEATADQGGSDPIGDATLGTNSSSEGRTGRTRR